MVQEMVSNLEKEQDEDDAHYSYCEDELSLKASKRDKLSEELEQLENKITNTQTAIDTTDEEMAALKAEIAALDKSVTDATEDRKQEHAEFTATTSELQLAVDLLLKAKGRLSSFYSPAGTTTPAPEALLQLGVASQTPAPAPAPVVQDELPWSGSLLDLRIPEAPPTPAPTTF